MVMDAPFPRRWDQAIRSAFARALHTGKRESGCGSNVSSATAEDLPEPPIAGQQENLPEISAAWQCDPRSEEVFCFPLQRPC